MRKLGLAVLAVMMCIVLLASPAMAKTWNSVQSLESLPAIAASTAGDIVVVTTLETQFTFTTFWYPTDLAAPAVAPSYKASVHSVTSLPTAGNTNGDLREVMSLKDIYRYSSATDAWSPLRQAAYMKRVMYEAKATMSGGTTVIATQVPTGAVLVGAQLRVDTAITNGTGGTTWAAAYSTGSTAAICTTQALAKNTKATKMFDANAATAITTGATDVTITISAGSMTGGVVHAYVTADVPSTLPSAS